MFLSRRIFGTITPGFGGVLHNLHDQGKTMDEGLAHLAANMCNNGLTDTNRRRTLVFQDFDKPKNRIQSCNDRDLRSGNSLPVKPVPLSLPSFAQLDDLFSVCRAKKPPEPEHYRCTI